MDFIGRKCPFMIGIILSHANWCSLLKISVTVCQNELWHGVCPADTVMVVTHALYERKQANICLPSSANCSTNSQRVHSFLQNKCYRQNECSFLVSTSNIIQTFIIEPCSHIPLYLQFTYLCTEDHVFHSFCSGDHLGTHGFLVSEGFPSPNFGAQCNLTIGSSRSRVDISLYQIKPHAVSLCNNILYIGTAVQGCLISHNDIVIDTGPLEVRYSVRESTTPTLLQYQVFEYSVLSATATSETDVPSAGDSALVKTSTVAEVVSVIGVSFIFLLLTVILIIYKKRRSSKPRPPKNGENDVNVSVNMAFHGGSGESRAPSLMYSEINIVNNYTDPTHSDDFQNDIHHTGAVPQSVQCHRDVCDVDLQKDRKEARLNGRILPHEYVNVSPHLPSYAVPHKHRSLQTFSDEDETEIVENDLYNS